MTATPYRRRAGALAARLTAAIVLASVPAVLRGQADSTSGTAPVPLSRAAAVTRAITRGGRMGVARADSLAAQAQLVTARAFQNPALAASYSRATPQYHVALELPLDFPWVRGLRIRSATAVGEAARLRVAYERASVALEADTTYTRALAARERARLSRRNALDADSLRRMAATRRDAGDPSDLDVELATVTAGQAAGAADADSLEALSALLDLQGVIGLAGPGLVVTLTDSLSAPSDVAPLPDDSALVVGRAVADGGSRGVAQGRQSGAAPAPLPVAAAEASATAARLGFRAARLDRFGVPALTAGFETGDPTGSEPGILPTFGVALPLPLLDRHRGPILAAPAERQRAEAELAIARVESRIAIARATRERAIALGRVARDRGLVAAAARVAAMSLTAYREGAASLPNVLEAQRNAREVMAQYVDDLAVAWNATATLRFVTLTSASPDALPR